MPLRRLLLAPGLVAFLAAGLLPVALAHGDGEHHDTPMAHNETVPSTDAYYNLPSYFLLDHHQTMITAHIALMLLSWVVILPIAVMMSIARSKWTTRWQFVFLLVNGAGMLTGIIYNRATADLYPNNAHHKMGWIFTFLALGWSVVGILKFHGPGREWDTPEVAPLPARLPFKPYTPPESSPYRWSGDSGQGTERNSTSLFGSPRAMSATSETGRFADLSFAEPLHEPEFEDVEDEEVEKHGFLSNSKVDRFLHAPKLHRVLKPAWRSLNVAYIVLERVLPVLGYLAITSGIITYSGIMQGNHVFNGLAHFIKGSIFFGYGVLNLGRWMGCFADFGWAWNVKPTEELVPRWKANMRSAEFTESAVIFTYGVTNVFLEHLGAWGGAWNAMDLEHVSITILFFGGGLMGMLVESRRIRKMLNATSLALRSSPMGQYEHAAHWREPVQYAFSMNPMPGLVILLLGLMMSGHHQHSMVSTMIHAQWGGLFVGYALARGVTYILLYLSPPSSYLPSRPPSELVASFCLMAGGLLFIMSNKDTVSALEVRDLDAMFVFTVTMGLTGVWMAWTVVLTALKGWASMKPVTHHTATGLGFSDVQEA